MSKKYQPHISSIGEANACLIAVVCYLVLISIWAESIIILAAIFVFEKKSGLVKFHSMQAILLWVCRFLFGGGLTFESLAALVTKNEMYLQNPYGWEADMPVLVIRIVVGGVILAFSILGAVYAARWETWRVPLVGQLAAAICKNADRTEYYGGGDVPVDCMLPKDKAEFSKPEVQAANELMRATAARFRRAGLVDEDGRLESKRDRRDMSVQPASEAELDTGNNDAALTDIGETHESEIVDAVKTMDDLPADNTQAETWRDKLRRRVAGRPARKFGRGYAAQVESGDWLAGEVGNTNGIKTHVHYSEIEAPENVGRAQKIGDTAEDIRTLILGQKEPADADAMQKPNTGGRNSSMQKVFEKLFHLQDVNVPTQDDRKDPNNQLPPDMRDSAPFVDMF